MQTEKQVAVVLLSLWSLINRNLAGAMWQDFCS